jgi:hypothetical protein
LKVTAGNGQATLSWTAPTDDGGSAVTDCFVHFSADGGRTWRRFLDGSGTDAVARAIGLTAGKSYLFRVATVNAIGVGSYSPRSGPITVA